MGCCNKFALFVVNFIIFGIGVAVVALASIVISKDSTYGALLHDGVLALPIIILIAGIVILIIGFLGCCGAMKESSCMLKTYACIVAVLFIAELVLGILILVYTDKAESIFKDTMDKNFGKYNGEDEAMTKTIDLTQHQLQCCGVTNYTDWHAVFDIPNLGIYDLPTSCCIDNSEDTCKGILNKTDFEKQIFIEGCFDTLENDIRGVAIGLGVACIILALVQILSISCACGIAKKSSEYA